ncbi:unnamed protein product [Spirodela intermedia]|uniref:ubiquitinyl hydrolase 1 n=1 Tax=Spirodela intermedia TaxID=51605 RepID=A0A7I8L8Q1_SPIIN|nr:unnamed protein product [Spirodela intermedia]
MGDGEQERQIYHEKQRLQFCLLHALNNLLQAGDSFSRVELDAIAEQLVVDDPEESSWWTPLSVVFRPHHNRLTGNYDVNVLIAALESRGRRVLWHDRRRGASSIGLGAPGEPAAAPPPLEGILLNVPVRKLAGLWKSRHWLTLRQIDGRWYNLDSDLEEPHPFKDEGDVEGFVDDVLADGGEVLLVLR